MDLLEIAAGFQDGLHAWSLRGLGGGMWKLGGKVCLGCQAGGLGRQIESRGSGDCAVPGKVMSARGLNGFGVSRMGRKLN